MARRSRAWVIAMAVLVAALFAPGTSLAGGAAHIGKAPPWRTLTDRDETTTSKCIGKPVTPICAVETARACFDRSRLELCRMAFLNGESETFHLGPPYPEYKTEYIIIRYQTIRQVPPPPPNLASGGGKFKEKPGDARVDFTARSCSITRDTCAGEPTESFGAITRHVGDRWFVIDYWAYHQPE